MSTIALLCPHLGAEGGAGEGHEEAGTELYLRWPSARTRGTRGQLRPPRGPARRIRAPRSWLPAQGAVSAARESCGWPAVMAVAHAPRTSSTQEAYCSSLSLPSTTACTEPWRCAGDAMTGPTRRAWRGSRVGHSQSWIPTLGLWDGVEWQRALCGSPVWHGRRWSRAGDRSGTGLVLAQGQRQGKGSRCARPQRVSLLHVWPDGKERGRARACGGRRRSGLPSTHPWSYAARGRRPHASARARGVLGQLIGRIQGDAEARRGC